MKPLQELITEPIIRKIDRRSFLKVSGMSVTGIILGVQFGCSPGKDENTTPFSPDAYLTINADGSVVIVAHRSEMGTGIYDDGEWMCADCISQFAK